MHALKPIILITFKVSNEFQIYMLHFTPFTKSILYMKLCILCIMFAMFLQGTISYQSNFARIRCQLLYNVFYLYVCMMVLELLSNSSTYYVELAKVKLLCYFCEKLLNTYCLLYNY